MWRMVDLTVINRPFLQGQGDARSLRIIDIPAYRGMISDRNGTPMAVSTPVNSVWVNPQSFTATSQQITQLSALLKLSSKTINQRINQAKQREFVYLKRHISPAIAKAIKTMKINGLHLQSEFRRYYPDGENIAHVIGFTDIDEKGIEGLEFAYDDWLKGVSGKRRVLKDRMGNIIEEIETLQEPRAGRDLQLSIDRRIQYIAYRELKKTVTKSKAKSGSVVVLDAKNGEILAMVNLPSFNPNSRKRYSDGRYRNRAMTDLFEPGSVIKPFSVAAALESGSYQPETVIDTSPSWMRVGDNIIKDGRDYGELTVTQVLQRSSNVGVAKMVLSNPAEQLTGLLSQVGFGQRSITGFPGESDGKITDTTHSDPFVLATIGFGYGLSVTTLQLAKAYLVFANEGKQQAVSLLHNVQMPKAKQVLSKEKARQVLTMLEAVVESGGTGRHAQVKGYRIAGKTGTARIAGEKGYQKNRHLATFVGIAPVSSPRLVIAVVINEPRKGSYYGGVVAAPLFAKIMAGSLSLLDIAPDDKTELNSHG